MSAKSGVSSNNYVCFSIVGTKDTVGIALRYRYIIFDFKEDLREEEDLYAVIGNLYEEGAMEALRAMNQ